MNYLCKTCEFELWLTIPNNGCLTVSTLGLYNDGKFPGRSLLALNTHFEDFAELDKDLMNKFMHDVQIVGRAIRNAMNADRINYAILGNTVPHVHAHIIPRFFKDDPNPNQSPWNRSDSGKAINLMPPSQCDEIINKIQKCL